MKKFFRNLGAKAQQWMAGRYGYDELCRDTSVAALIGLILSCFPSLRFLYLPTLLLWFWAVFRCYSKNLAKRRGERDAYLRFTGRIKGWFALQKRAWNERKTHRYFRCRQCKAVLRVPKGKGKITITCAKCHSEIVKKT